MSGRLFFIPFAYSDGSVLTDSSLARLQIMDVFDDLVDLCVAERRAERGHHTRFAVLDAVTEKFVVSFCIHELRPFPGRAATVGVTKPACRCEQLVDIECRVIRRRGRRLRMSRRGVCQRS